MNNSAATLASAAPASPPPSVSGQTAHGQPMPDLAPGIHRQRLVIEGLTQQSMTAMMLKNYLAQLAVELDMVALTDPVLHRSETYGWAGWMHWETSGCHVYALYDKGSFSVEIYTCKVFRNEDAVAFTKAAFEADTIVHRSL